MDEDHERVERASPKLDRLAVDTKLAPMTDDRQAAEFNGRRAVGDNIHQGECTGRPQHFSERIRPQQRLLSHRRVLSFSGCSDRKQETAALFIGGTALGTAPVAAKTARLSEYPLDISSGREHIAALSRGLATFGTSARAGIEAANALGDADTPDLFTQISRGVDKLLWKVEAHVQAKD